METLLVLVLLGWQVAVSIPQITRLARTRRVGGVSVAGDLLTIMSGLGWMAWALTAGDVATMVSGALVIVGYGPTVALTARYGGRLDQTDRTMLALGFSGLVVAAATGQLGWSLLVFAAVQYAPYVKAVVTADTTDGVSVIANVMRAVYGFGWTVYGLAAAEWPLIAWGAATTIVFGMVAVTGRARRVPTPAGV